MSGSLIFATSGALPLLGQLPRRKGNRYLIGTLILYRFPHKIPKDHSDEVITSEYKLRAHSPSTQGLPGTWQGSLAPWHVLGSSRPQILLVFSFRTFNTIKIIENPKKLLLMRVIFIHIYLELKQKSLTF